MEEQQKPDSEVDVGGWGFRTKCRGCSSESEDRCRLIRIDHLLEVILMSTSGYALHKQNHPPRVALPELRRLFKQNWLALVPKTEWDCSERPGSATWKGGGFADVLLY